MRASGSFLPRCESNPRCDRQAIGVRGTERASERSFPGTSRRAFSIPPVHSSRNGHNGKIPLDSRVPGSANGHQDRRSPGLSPGNRGASPHLAGPSVPPLRSAPRYTYIYLMLTQYLPFLSLLLSCPATWASSYIISLIIIPNNPWYILYTRFASHPPIADLIYFNHMIARKEEWTRVPLLTNR